MAKSPDQLKENIPNKKNIVAEVQELKSTNYTLSTKNTELKKEHANLKAALANADEKLKTVSANTETEVVKNLKILNSRVSSEKAELEKKYTKLEGEHANLKNALASADKDNKDVAKTTEDTSNKGTVVNPSLIHTNFIAIPNTKTIDESGNIVAKVQELEKKNNTLSKEKAALEEEYANLKNALASTEEKLKTVSISTDEKLKALENKNSTIFNEKAELEKEHTNLKAALANADEKLKTVSTNNECTISNSELFIQEKYEALKIKYSNLKTNFKTNFKAHYDDFKANAKASYDNLKTNFWDLKNKLSDGFNDLKTKFSNTNTKLENKAIITNKADEPTSINSEKNAYDMLNPTIEKIKSEYFFSNNNGDEVEKDTSTSINQRESNTKCFEISGSSLKSLESESSDCEKIYSLHNFLDSIGMDEDDANHLQFLNFMNTNNASKLESMVATNFSNFIKRYSHSDKDGKKVIKYAEGQECFKMENEKVSTYGENSFSDECAPLVNLYILLQTANDNEIWHYENYDLTHHDDAEFNKILAFEFIDN